MALTVNLLLAYACAPSSPSDPSEIIERLAEGWDEVRRVLTMIGSDEVVIVACVPMRAVAVCHHEIGTNGTSKLQQTKSESFGGSKVAER